MININNRKLCEYCFAETDREPCPKCGFSSVKYKRDFTVLEVGSVLEDRYVIGGVIGKGGFGITYLAYDRKLERRVAIKEYYPNGLAVRNIGSTFVSAANAESVETFQGGADKFYDEARLMAKFNENPNIVNVYDFFYENDTVYFTMGFLSGQTLKAYLKEHGVLSPGQAVGVAGDITNALIAAHHLNVLHRDISPDNIMVCSDGTVKLLDFGAARQVLTEGSQSLSVILKQGFAPLEQYQKRGKQGPWTDIYALGATLYYALTLDLLDDPMSRLDDDSEYNSNIHGIEEPLWEVIQKATMLKASERYHDIYELKVALDSLSIQPIRLTIPLEAVNEIKFEETVQTEINSHSVSNTQKNAGIMGETMPLKDAATDVTMPLEDSTGTVGETMALQEDAAAAGITVPLEDNVADVTVPLQDDMSKQPKLQPEPQPEPQSEEQSEPKSVQLGKFIKRRVMVAVICAFILIGAAGVFFWQSFGRSSGYLDYSIYSEYVEIASCSDLGVEKVEIPSEIDGKPVTKIGEDAFKDCENLSSLTIPDGVTKIGDSAFYGCSSLSSLTIPDDVTEIGTCAFSGCSSLSSLTIPGGVTEIGYGTFRGCSSLSSLTIPDSVTEIGQEAFSDCSSLSSLTIPDSVTKIGDGAFSECSSLSSLAIPSGTKIGKDAFAGCPNLILCYVSYSNHIEITSYMGRGTKVEIPSEIYGKPVTEIGEEAFDGCSSLNSLTIPDSVTKIGDRAFWYCNSLSSITIPSGTKIGKNAFAECPNLILCYVSYSNHIEIAAYMGKGTKVEIPSEIYGKPVTEIGKEAFWECSSLSSVTIPDSVTKIGEDAFMECSSLSSVTISDSVTKIGDGAFSECSSLSSVTIPDSVTEIGVGAFSDCSSLSSVIIPDSVTEIGTCAFEDCSSLSSVTIPDSVTEIGGGAFEDCSSLSSITIPDSVTEIGWGAFRGCSSLSSVTIPDSVTYIGTAYTFNGCSSLSSITIPDSVTEIGECAFRECSSLRSITIPDSVAEIGSSAFRDCSSLRSITIPDSVTKIGAAAFLECSSLRSITIPDSVTEIGQYAFGDCSSLRNITIPDSVTEIGKCAFEDCSSLRNITIPRGTKIGKDAFKGCPKNLKITRKD